jgi:hypothetical protein
MSNNRSARGSFIELTRDQIDAIVTQAADKVTSSQDGGSVGVPPTDERMIVLFESVLRDRKLNSSVILGFIILACFPMDGSERAVADIARQLKASPTTVHRFVKTWRLAGVLHQNPVTRCYGLCDWRRTLISQGSAPNSEAAVA